MREKDLRRQLTSADETDVLPFEPGAITERSLLAQPDKRFVRL
jgi:hypothetical protein